MDRQADRSGDAHIAGATLVPLAAWPDGGRLDGERAAWILRRRRDSRPCLRCGPETSEAVVDALTPGRFWFPGPEIHQST